ncbi:hypothetical protein SORBI_3001G198200, partial [Sorghum bicolor]
RLPPPRPLLLAAWVAFHGRRERERESEEEGREGEREGGAKPYASSPAVSSHPFPASACAFNLCCAMEVFGKSVIAEPSNVIFLSAILNTEGSNPSHKCDKRCQNEHIFGNMYRCKLTGTTHICDKNCNQRILYDNHNSLCRVSGQFFPLSPLEQQAVRGIRRKHEVDSNEGCSFKRRRGAQLHPSPFERSYSAVSPIPSQVGDGMDLS